MNKRHLHHVWKRLRLIKPWYFLVILAISLPTTVFAMRGNNQHMALLRKAVATADTDNTDVQAPLRALQAYVTSHMNTDLRAGSNGIYPPIQLQHTYDRLVQARGDKLTAENSLIYNDAQHYCEAANPTGFYGAYRISCIEQYITSHPTQTAPPIQDALYKFDFISPSWSPDLAGWSLLVTIASAVLFVLTLLTKLWFKRNI